MRLLILAIILIITATIAAPAAAQTTTPTPTPSLTPTPIPGYWSHTFDFTQGQFGWRTHGHYPNSSSWIAGTGWRSLGSGANMCGWNLGGQFGWNCAAIEFPVTIPAQYVDNFNNYITRVVLTGTVSGYGGAHIRIGRTQFNTSDVAYLNQAVTATYEGVSPWLGNQGFPTVSIRGSYDYVQVMTITRLVVEGVGYDPFASSMPTPTPTITPTFTPTPNPLSASFTWQCNGSCSAPTSVAFTYTGQGAQSFSWSLGNGGTSAAQNPTATYADAGVYPVTLTVTGTGGATASSTQDITILGAGLPGSGILYQPLSLQDQFGSLPIWDRDALIDYAAGNLPNPWTPVPSQVVAMSNRAGDHVFSVAGGLVISMEPASSCEQLGLQPALGRCVQIASHPDQPLGAKGFALSLDDVWIVRVGFDTGRDVWYAVAAADRYLTEGAEIQGGCIVGETIGTDPIITMVDLVAELDIQLAEVGGSIGGELELFGQLQGFAFVSLQNQSGYRQPLLSMLTAPPLDDRACNINPETASCIGDPGFDRPDTWQRQGDARWNYLYDNVELSPNARIWQEVSLSELLAYSFRVDLVSQGSGGSVLLEIGTTAEEFTIGSRQSFQIAAAIHSPNADGTYRISITNTGLTTIDLVENCVSRGTPSTLPQTCLFANYSFDNGTTSWTTSGGVFQEARGEIIFEDDGSIAQNIELWPDGASTYEYQLTVKARPIGFPNAASNTTDTIAIEYRYGSGSWQSMNPQAEIPTPIQAFYGNQVNNILYFEGGFRLFTAMVAVTQFANDSLQIRVQIDAAGDGLVGITEACINDDFGTFPGSTGGGTTGTGGGNPAPVFGYTCNLLDRPASGDIGPWIAYLWGQLERFFRCDLMRALNTIIDAFVDAIDLAQWAILYAQEVAQRTWTWVGNSLIPWANAHARNIVIASQTSVTGGGGAGCDNIFCLITTLAGVVNTIVGFFTTLVNLAGQVIGLVVNVVFGVAITIITQLFNLVGLATGMITTLLQAYITSTPTEIQGLPNCTDYRSSGWCAAFWVLDNTILSGSVGGAIVPTLVGIFSIHLLISIAYRIRRAVVSIGGSA